MPARKGLPIRLIRPMLRLVRDGASAREIGRTLGIARSTVQDNLARLSAAGLTVSIGEEVIDAIPDHLLTASASGRASNVESNLTGR